MSLIVIICLSLGRLAYENASLKTSIDHIDSCVVYVNLEISNISDKERIKLPGLMLGVTKYDIELLRGLWGFNLYHNGKRVCDLRPFIKMDPSRYTYITIPPGESKSLTFTINLANHPDYIDNPYPVFDGYSENKDYSGDYSIQVFCCIPKRYRPPLSKVQYSLFSNIAEFRIP